ncbi:MAG: sodium:proton antiporter [Deltaproteobacteria bacterium]|nr:sodium:proton antiporter [Deltaproteobacteria bacterium]
MHTFGAVAFIITLAAVFAYINKKFLGLPTVIGLMLISLVVSLVITGMGMLGVNLALLSRIGTEINAIDFNKTLMHGMLSFLLFAGALTIDINDLAGSKWIISLLATLGVITATLLVGYAGFFILSLAGFGVPLIYCLLFGALISPTDPVAVLAVIRSAGAPKSLETIIAGESLFNDGVGVVVFLVLSEIAAKGGPVSMAHIFSIFAREAGGGIVFGLCAGYAAFLMIRRIDDYQTEILLTLALVMGGYALASALHISGPIAIVVAGLLIGNHGRLLGMSEKTRLHLDNFWELIDEILNAALFVLIGLELLFIPVISGYAWAGLAMIPVVLAARFISVSAPISILDRWKKFPPGTVKILTWAGLRGGISIALALSLPAGHTRDAIVAMTYVVVVFSILVQGTTLGRMLAKK